MSYIYRSHRAQLLQDYLKYKRNLGFIVENDYQFNKMDRFFIEMNRLDSIGISKQEADEWNKFDGLEQSGSQYNRINQMIGFSIYLRHLGYESAIPEQIKRINSFQPYIFTKNEIERIFIAANKLTCDKSHSCRNILATYFELLYSTGIRKSEGLKLTIEDVNLEKGTILIRETKNGRDRILPLSDSMHERMIIYSNKYNVLVNSSDKFFRTIDNREFSIDCVNYWFVKILYEAKIPYLSGGHGPRVHDLRFSFACHSLVKMEQSGMDIYVELPILSQYMGHVSIESTEYYISLTQDLFPELIKNRSKVDSKTFPEVS